MRGTTSAKPDHFYAFTDSTGERHVRVSKRPGMTCAMVCHLPAQGILKARKEITLSLRPDLTHQKAKRIRENGHIVDVVEVELISPEEALQLRRAAQI